MYWFMCLTLAHYSLFYFVWIRTYWLIIYTTGELSETTDGINILVIAGIAGGIVVVIVLIIIVIIMIVCIVVCYKKKGNV